MTLNDITAVALQRLNRGTDTQTVSSYNNIFRIYANKAVRRIAEKYKPCKSETVLLNENKMFSVDALSRGCYKIVGIYDENENSIGFKQRPAGSGMVKVDTTRTSVTVEYRYVPKDMVVPSDSPEIPKFLHDIITHYVVACERAGGDPDTQGTASVDFQLFNEGLANIPSSSLGEADSYKLLNYWS